MSQHELKTWPGPFAALVLGDKTHEVRSTRDRFFVVGDTLVLVEYVPCAKCGGTRIYGCPSCKGVGGKRTGRTHAATVTHITEGGTFGLPRDVCVMSIARVSC